MSTLKQLGHHFLRTALPAKLLLVGVLLALAAWTGAHEPSHAGSAPPPAAAAPLPSSETTPGDAMPMSQVCDIRCYGANQRCLSGCITGADPIECADKCTAVLDACLASCRHVP
jgi:hypothetical protein